MAIPFPVFLKLDGRRCLLVGAGKVAEQKIAGLLSAGAEVHVVAPRASDRIRRLAAAQQVQWSARAFVPGDLDDVVMVVAATSDPVVNGEIVRQAEARRVLCNVVDDPKHCGFYYPAVVRRGDLQIAISTAGHSPALAQRLREDLEKAFGPEYGSWLRWLGAVRMRVFRRILDPQHRRLALHRLASREGFEHFMRTRITPNRKDSAMRKVYLVGAGPGDPELLTLKAARLLGQADVVLHDALVSQAILDLVRPGAKLIDVGKRCGNKLFTQQQIDSMIVFYAVNGQMVVRLKGGDPSIFGRSGEEIEAVARAGVDFEIVPGITAALASAAAAGISLTDRRFASSVVFTTAHRSSGAEGMAWDKLVSSNSTLAIHMPGSDYARLCAELGAAGLESLTPCVVVSSAGRSTQKVLWTNLAALSHCRALPAPSLLIVGRCAFALTQLRTCGGSCNFVISQSGKFGEVAECDTDNRQTMHLGRIAELADEQA